MVWSVLRRAENAPLALALQGGGAHGAFTWGVLDALLEHTTHPFVALSGTSAGAVNAVVMAHGMLEAGRDGARAALTRFWESVGRAIPWDATGWIGHAGDRMTPAGRLMLQWVQALSPAQANPLRIDPLRDLLLKQVDFERLRRRSPLRIWVAATHANTGRLRVFDSAELSIDAVMASACLPTMQSAVMIDGEPYWDGGYSANPALFPLVFESGADDLMVVMLSPWTLGETPTSADGIRLRAIEIAFNATFLREMRTFADATELARHALLPGLLERRLRRIRWHLIDGHDALSTLPSDSKLVAHPQFLQRLHDAGHSQAMTWLEREGRNLGRRTTADLRHLFGNHLPPRHDR
jgi:NTE family protein